MGTQVGRKPDDGKDTRELAAFLLSVKGRFADEATKSRRRLAEEGPGGPGSGPAMSGGASPAHAARPGTVGAPVPTAVPGARVRAQAPKGLADAEGTTRRFIGEIPQLPATHDGHTRRLTKADSARLVPAGVTTQTRRASPPRWTRRGLIWASIAGGSVPIALGFLLLPYMVSPAVVVVKGGAPGDRLPAPAQRGVDGPDSPEDVGSVAGQDTFDSPPVRVVVPGRRKLRPREVPAWAAASALRTEAAPVGSDPLDARAEDSMMSGPGGPPSAGEPSAEPVAVPAATTGTPSSTPGPFSPEPGMAPGTGPQSPAGPSPGAAPTDPPSDLQAL